MCKFQNNSLNVHNIRLKNTKNENQGVFIIINKRPFLLLLSKPYRIELSEIEENSKFKEQIHHFSKFFEVVQFQI